MKALIAALLLISACRQGPAPTQTRPKFAPVPDYPAEQNLIDASASVVPSMDPAAPAELTGVWRWIAPRRAATVLVWSICKGSGDTRSCVVFAGHEATNVQVSIDCPAGWAPPKIETGPGEEELVVFGEDGRGPWTRVISQIGGKWTCGEPSRPAGT